MVLLGLVACFIALTHANPEYKRLGRFVLLCLSISLVVAFIEYYEEIYELVEFKLLTTQLGDSAAEGGTTAARWGFVRASIFLALENPLFGVGITNFETAYDGLQEMLGPDYWPSDNPHSAWLYLIACFGIPATIIFVLIFYTFAVRFYRFLPLRKFPRLLYISTAILILLISGATQLQLIAQYFFWFLVAVVSGLKLDGGGYSLQRKLLNIN
jgi:O-antigen ligase